jgi:hypothetical protein
MDWRRVLGFADDEELTFAEVHERFRDLMAGPELLPEELFHLGDALEAARKELGTSRPEKK